MFEPNVEYRILSYEKLCKLGSEVTRNGDIYAPRSARAHFNYRMLPLCGSIISTQNSGKTKITKNNGFDSWSIGLWMCEKVVTKKILALRAINRLKD